MRVMLRMAATDTQPFPVEQELAAITTMAVIQDQYFLVPNIVLAPTLTNNFTANIPALNFTSNTPAVSLEYAIQRGSDIRTGVMQITQYKSGMAFTDDYTETANIGVTLNVTQAANTAQVSYTTTNTGTDANLKYILTSITF